jgi:hypothetical protein
VDHLGTYQCNSKTLMVTALPASFGFSSTVVGGQVAYPSPPEIVPQPGSPSSSGTPMWVHVQFSVSCISGKPSLHLYELRANA